MISWSLIWIALGGALGAVARYVVGLCVGFPFGTLTVNIFGSFLMGLVFIYLNHKGLDRWQPFLLIGLLGGFTTFSAFSLDTLRLYEDGRLMGAGIYIVASVFLSLIALVFGLFLAREVLT
jgi:fluoride exporter